jgi:hypothetical protein
MRNAGAAWPVVPALGRDAFLGEIRGLWGAEHSLLAALQAWATTPGTDARRAVVVEVVTHAGERLARLEQVCSLLREAPSGRYSGDMWRIFERYAPLRVAQAGDAATLDAALREALGYLRVAYAIAAARARAARLTEAARLLGAAHDDACRISAMVAGADVAAAPPRFVKSPPAVRHGRRAAAPSAAPRPTPRTPRL